MTLREPLDALIQEAAAAAGPLLADLDREFLLCLVVTGRPEHDRTLALSRSGATLQPGARVEAVLTLILDPPSHERAAAVLTATLHEEPVRTFLERWASDPAGPARVKKILEELETVLGEVKVELPDLRDSPAVTLRFSGPPPEQPDLVVSLNGSDLPDLLRGGLEVREALAQKRIVLTGDPSLLMQLMPLFP